MKTSAIGMVSAAVLILVAGVGFGIAQAAGNQSYDPMLSFGDQDVNPNAVVGQNDEFVPESNYAGTDWQVRGAVETGSLPAGSNADSSKFPTEADVYQGSGYIDMGGNE